MKRAETWAWPASFGPPPTLRTVVGSMGANIADAEKRYQEASRRYQLALPGTEKLIQADYDRRARGAELAHWHSEDKHWRGLLCDYPHLADKPGEAALRSRLAGEPAAPLPAADLDDEALWSPGAA